MALSRGAAAGGRRARPGRWGRLLTSGTCRARGGAGAGSGRAEPAAGRGARPVPAPRAGAGRAAGGSPGGRARGWGEAAPRRQRAGPGPRGASRCTWGRAPRSAAADGPRGSSPNARARPGPRGESGGRSPRVRGRAVGAKRPDQRRREPRTDGASRSRPAASIRLLCAEGQPFRTLRGRGDPALFLNTPGNAASVSGKKRRRCPDVRCFFPSSFRQREERKMRYCGRARRRGSRAVLCAAGL